jgi:uncharacterized protein YodC (DUF2158 family)
MIEDRYHGVGTRVRLNSGGPDMLVVDLMESTAVVVSWRDSFGNVHESRFPNQCVQRRAWNAAVRGRAE